MRIPIKDIITEATAETPELGKASPFHNRGFNIIRSKYSEIK